MEENQLAIHETMPTKKLKNKFKNFKNMEIQNCA